MDWLNYHHLFYFWTVAREGSVTRASERLNLTQPTVTAQVRLLERRLGERLFERTGRRLELTEVGRTVYRYADEIFALGRELLGAVKDRPVGRPLRLFVGLANVVPKLVAFRLLKPALELPEPVTVVCREDTTERLLAALALHELDVVISDAPAGAGLRVRAFNHPLGECGVSFFARPNVARRYRRRFPRSLDGAPFLMPTETSLLRRSLDTWFDSRQIRPRTVGEFDDSALLKTFGQAGVGVFSGPTAIESEIRRQYGVSLVGRAEEVRERFFAISAERRLKHPAVVAISEAARAGLFG